MAYAKPLPQSTHRIKTNHSLDYEAGEWLGHESRKNARPYDEVKDRTINDNLDDMLLNCMLRRIQYRTIEKFTITLK